MDLSNENVLLFPRTMQLGGTENVVIQLCEILLPKVNSLIVCSCGGINEKRLTEMGIKHFLIPDIENKRINNVIDVFCAISGIIKTEQITVIHAHHRMAAFYSNIIPAARKCKKIATAHNTFYDKKKLTSFAYVNFKIVACGEKVKQNLCEYYKIPSNRVAVVHNAVKAFDGMNKKYPLIEKQGEKYKVANIGRLSEQKGFEYYIDAAKEILTARNDIIFYIVGEGSDRENLQKRCVEYGIEDSVIFMGYQNRIQDIISQMDLVVLSSLWEGFPLTPIETFSVGKTIVATAVDGTIEIVKDGINGYLVEKKDYITMGKRIIDLIDDKEKKALFEKNAYLFYCDEFSMEKLSEGYIEQYQEL